jgi:hypothetical protein
VTRWLRALLWMVGFGCLWLNVLDDPPLHTDAYVLDVGADRAVIGLITAVPERVAMVMRDAGGAEVAAQAAGEARRRHQFAVAGLRPGLAYDYALTAADGRAWTGRVRTVPGGDRAAVRFAFLGDSGDQPWWVWLQRTPALHWPARWGWFGDSAAVTGVGRAVAAYRPDFVLHLGDVIYPRGLHAHYRPGFFRPFGEVLREAPMYALLGNHDVIDGGGQQLVANLRAPGGAFGADGRNLSFAWGPVRVIGLDCNTDYTGERYEVGHPAQAFLARELAASTEPWIVVATHFPMRSASRQMDRAELLLAMLPELAEHQVSLYLSGHDHCYQRYPPKQAGEPVLVVSGGGGKDLYAVRPDPRAAKLVSAYHWCSVEVAAGVLRLRAHGLDGAVLDEFRLELPTGDGLAQLRRKAPARADRVAALR